MIRSLLILALLAGTASAQQWSPNSGWESEGERQLRESRAAFEAKRQAMRDDFERTSKQMDEDFNRDSRNAFLVFGAIAASMIIVTLIAASRRRRTIYEPTIEAVEEPSYIAQLPTGSIDVSVLRIGVDGRSSKLLSTELDRLAKQYETTSAAGRSQFLRELGIVLRRVRAAWQYGGAVNEPMRSLSEARAVVAKHVDEARIAGSDLGDGTGIVIATIVVAARGELMSVDHIGAEELRRALEAAAYRDENELVEVAVVARRFSSVAELEQAYPRPAIVPLASPVSGQIFCTYCGGPFPQELTTCPHCGAPARKAA